jgi:hypothetical protein
VWAETALKLLRGKNVKEQFLRKGSCHQHSSCSKTTPGRAETALKLLQRKKAKKQLSRSRSCHQIRNDSEPASGQQGNPTKNLSKHCHSPKGNSLKVWWGESSPRRPGWLGEIPPAGLAGEEKFTRRPSW